MLHRCGIILFAPATLMRLLLPPPTSFSTPVAREVSDDNLCKIYMRVSRLCLDSHATSMHAELSHFWRWCFGACCGAVVLLACIWLAYFGRTLSVYVYSLCASVCVCVCGPIYTISLW